MSQSQLKFKINQPHVVAENFDDEVIAINLDTGRYYSIGQSGATVWTLVSSGATFSEVMAEVRARYLGEPAMMEQAVEQFVAELQRTQLIVAQSNGVNAAFPNLSKPTTIPPEKNLFNPPILCEYSDMQDLLLLDPIHDVDETGWPKRKTA